ncbi:MAG: sugar transferase [Verrucomicrobia bacterium]|jgi:lipopolysaccharide/colanic/teichoic acid biosynthesis glycosyltransferase|nr:sugar transferase [Verrucomicrobiota bacterium]
MKRLLDLLWLLLSSPVWVPLLVLTAGIVLIRMGRPLFFRQERAGKGGRPFRLVKFRTMTQARDGEGNLLPDAQRLPAFGAFLRGTSLDELPEIWNILRGDMTLVGPRPLPVRYVPRYSPEQARRLEVLPGLTGWAQIKGRNDLGWEERFRLDVWYVDHRSLLLDLVILGRTVLAVLRREGIAAEGEATMAEFTGPDRPEGTRPALREDPPGDRDRARRSE